MGVLTTRFAIYSAKDGGDAKQKRFCMEPAASVPLLKNQFFGAANIACLRTLSLSNALRKRNNSAASKFENFCVAEFIRMLFYAGIKLSPLPKNLSQREKTVFIQNDVFEPRRVLRVEP